jgi:hypothetical protein
MMMGMRIARGISVTLELTGFLLLLRLQDVAAMIRVNGLLGMAGPVIFITVMALGLAGSVGSIPLWKIGLIFAGVVLIVLGTR